MAQSQDVCQNREFGAYRPESQACLRVFREHPDVQHYHEQGERAITRLLQLTLPRGVGCATPSAAGFAEVAIRGGARSAPTTSSSTAAGPLRVRTRPLRPRMATGRRGSRRPAGRVPPAFSPSGPPTRNRRGQIVYARIQVRVTIGRERSSWPQSNHGFRRMHSSNP